MIRVNGLIWDDWNKKHIARHRVTIEEVEEVFLGTFRAVESHRKRIQISGSTRSGRKLTIILSPEDRNLTPYENDMYYPITAFEEVK